MTSHFLTWLDAHPVRPMPPLLRAMPLLLTSALALFFVVDAAALSATRTSACTAPVAHVR